MSSSTSSRSTFTRVLREPARHEVRSASFRTVGELEQVVPPPDPTGMPQAELELIERLRAEAHHGGHQLGFEKGLAEGRARGFAEGIAAGREHSSRAMRSLEEAAADLERRDAVQLHALQREIVEFAFAVVQSLLQRELHTSESPGREAIVRALALAPDRGAIRVRINPSDVDTIGALDSLVPGRNIEVVPDGLIEPGGAVVEVGACRVDAQLEAALDRVRKELS